MRRKMSIILIACVMLTIFKQGAVDIKAAQNEEQSLSVEKRNDKLIKVTENNVEGNIEDAANGYIRYAKEKGYTNSEFKGIENEPSVAWIKNKLEYNRPILMGYGIKVKDGDGEIERAGHFISILGHVRAQKGNSGNTYNYLMVYNGWYNQISYINYTTVDFMDCKATYFWTK